MSDYNQSEQFLLKYKEFSKLIEKGKIIVSDDGMVCSDKGIPLMWVDHNEQAIFIKSGDENIRYVPREERKPDSTPADSSKDSSLILTTMGATGTYDGHACITIQTPPTLFTASPIQSGGFSSEERHVAPYRTQPLPVIAPMMVGGLVTNLGIQALVCFDKLPVDVIPPALASYAVLGVALNFADNLPRPSRVIGYDERWRGFSNSLSIPCTNEQAATLLTDIELDNLSEEKFSLLNLGGKNCTGYLTKKMEDVGIDIISILGIKHSLAERLPIRPASLNRAADRIGGSQKKLAEFYIEGLDVESPITFYEATTPENGNKILLISGGDTLKNVLYFNNQTEENDRGLNIDINYLLRHLNEHGLQIKGSQLLYLGSDGTYKPLDGSKVVRVTHSPKIEDIDYHDNAAEKQLSQREAQQNLHKLLNERREKENGRT